MEKQKGAFDNPIQPMPNSIMDISTISEENIVSGPQI